MKVAVVMGSKNDMSVVGKTLETLEKFGISFEARVISAHRSPEIAAEFAKTAEERGVEVIIAAAGKAAHLAGVMAGHAAIPVIGLPIRSSMMDGLDSLLSTVQMPDGIPVATVAVNGAANAAILAAQILAVKYESIRKALKDYKFEMQQKVIQADEQLQAEAAK
jgi:5-(carboxyamino)imidazole ribonucleotide mutase